MSSHLVFSLALWALICSRAVCSPSTISQASSWGDFFFLTEDCAADGEAGHFIVSFTFRTGVDTGVIASFSVGGQSISSWGDPIWELPSGDRQEHGSGSPVGHLLGSLLWVPTGCGCGLAHQSSWHTRTQIVGYQYMTCTRAGHPRVPTSI